MNYFYQLVDAHNGSRTQFMMGSVANIKASVNALAETKKGEDEYWTTDDCFVLILAAIREGSVSLEDEGFSNIPLLRGTTFLIRVPDGNEIIFKDEVQS